MAFVDYYKILGVDKNIPQKDVRAYCFFGALLLTGWED